MLILAAASGTTDIVATPHSNHRYRYDPELIDQWIVKLTAPGHPRIHKACDVLFDFDNIRRVLADPPLLSINGLGYMLIEFSNYRIEAATTKVLCELQEAGITPVITHPERNALLRQSRRDLKGWVEIGCLLQITGGSLVGDFGKPARVFCEQLINEGLVHFVASDAHDLKHRTTDLRSAFAAVQNRWSAALARTLFCDNGALALNGLPIAKPNTQRRVSWLAALR